MTKNNKPMTITHTVGELLAQDRHTDWAIAQEAGRLRNGRSYILGGFQGTQRTKRAHSQKACRGKVAF